MLLYIEQDGAISGLMCAIETRALHNTWSTACTRQAAGFASNQQLPCTLSCHLIMGALCYCCTAMANCYKETYGKMLVTVLQCLLH
jgi:hypothetical protein